MDVRLRQIALIAQNKEQTVAEFGALLDMRPVHGSGDLSPYGLPAKGPMSEGGKQILDQLGVENLLFAAGCDIVEVLFTTRPRSSPERQMERRGGATGYMIILQTDDLEPFKRRAAAEGVRVTHESRLPNYHDIHLHPKDCGGALLSMARHLPENVVNGPWYPGGKLWETMAPSTLVSAVPAVELQSQDPQGLAERWARLVGGKASSVGADWIVELEHGTIRFIQATDGRGEGFSGFDLKVRDRERILTNAQRMDRLIGDATVTICGMRAHLVE